MSLRRGKKKKKKEDEETKKDPAKKPVDKYEYKYDAEVSFFDNLDSGMPERRPRSSKNRREVDTETFGDEAQNYAPRSYRRRYRGGRRNNRYNGNRRYH